MGGFSQVPAPASCATWGSSCPLGEIQPAFAERRGQAGVCLTQRLARRKPECYFHAQCIYKLTAEYLKSRKKWSFRPPHH